MCFKESLREEFPNVDVITPEILVHGFSLPVVNIVPGIESENMGDPSSGENTDSFREEYSKLILARSKMNKIYQEEFIPKLIDQAIDRHDRYRPVIHDSLHIGDIVLLKERLQKPGQYNIGVVKEVFTNSLNEVTGVSAFKGISRAPFDIS